MRGEGEYHPNISQVTSCAPQQEEALVFMLETAQAMAIDSPNGR